MMCQVTMPAVYKITVLQPHADTSSLSTIADAALAAWSEALILAALMIALIAFCWMISHESPARNEARCLRAYVRNNVRNNIINSSVCSASSCIRIYPRISRNRIGIAAPVFLFIIFMSQGIALCEKSPELTVLGPADNILGSTIKDISQSFSDSNNIPVNITQIKGREMVAKEVSKNTSTVDVVILEREYPLFNLTGMIKLKKNNLIDNYTYLYSERALLIFKKGESISDIGDLDGLRIAVTDQHVPGACLARKIVAREGLNVSEVNESSNEAQLDAVLAGRANATVLWESMFEEYENSTDQEIEVLDIPDYRMDNYIAVLRSSDDPDKAMMYVKYLLSALANASDGREGVLVRV